MENLTWLQIICISLSSFIILEISLHFHNTLSTCLNYLNVLRTDLCSIHQQDLHILPFQNYTRFHSCTWLFLDPSSTFWKRRWAEFLQREIGQETTTSTKILKKIFDVPMTQRILEIKRISLTEMNSS